MKEFSYEIKSNKLKQWNIYMNISDVRIAKWGRGRRSLKTFSYIAVYRLTQLINCVV